MAGRDTFLGNLTKYAALVCCTLILLAAAQTVRAEAPIKLGLNYPKTGLYAGMGLDELRGAQMAVEEVNAAGGVLGRQLELVLRDTRSKPVTAAGNAESLIDVEKVHMIFGGATSTVAQAVSNLCQEKGMLYIATVAGSPDLTGLNAHRNTFRVGYNAGMDSQALAMYLLEHFSIQKYFYIVADCPMGLELEKKLRKLTNTENDDEHGRALTPFPIAKERDFKKAMSKALAARPDIVLMIQFGKNITTGIMQASVMGLKDKMQLVVPFLEMGIAENLPPKMLEGVIGTTDWSWEVPYRYNYKRGKQFVEKFSDLHTRYPSWGAATAYTAVHQYAEAVARAESVDVPAVIKALEGHAFILLKNKQMWRDFDHQTVQSVYIVRGNPADTVLSDKFHMGFLEVVHSVPWLHTSISREDWNEARWIKGKPLHLEPLPGEPEPVAGDRQ